MEGNAHKQLKHVVLSYEMFHYHLFRVDTQSMWLAVSNRFEQTLRLQPKHRFETMSLLSR